MSPEVVADKVLDAIREEKLSILTHPEFNESIRQRVEGTLAGWVAGNPLSAVTGTHLASSRKQA